MKLITRNIWLLCFVSLFTDMASEMLYPVVPVYLRSIGFSIFLIGLLEGLAELVVGFSKGYFGQLSDRRGRRLPFVQLGYLLSALSKPMMAIFTYPWWVFLARSTDRLGKGVRTAARDALLSANATPQTKGRIFAFHRGWDTVGAILGPLMALAFLHFYPGRYRSLFFWALLPGLLAVAFTLLVKEKRVPVSDSRKGNFFAYFSYWKKASPEYRRLVSALILFAAGNSSDVFLLLQARIISGSDSISISAYIFYNLVYAASSYPLGILADRVGLRKVLLAGILLFSVTYAGFAVVRTEIWLYLLFFLYGLYAAATEGIAKAWISNLARAGETATAIGLFSSLQSLAGFVASLLAGLLWAVYGAGLTFGSSALIAAAACWMLMRRSWPGRKQSAV